MDPNARPFEVMEQDRRLEHMSPPTYIPLGQIQDPYFHITAQPNALSCLAIDSQSNLLWTGDTLGNLSSFDLGSGELYTRRAFHSNIRTVFPIMNNSDILVLTSTEASLVNVGAHVTYRFPLSRSDEQQRSLNLRCALVHPFRSGTTMYQHGVNRHQASSVLSVSGHLGLLYSFDLGRPDQVLASFDYNSTRNSSTSSRREVTQLTMTDQFLCSGTTLGLIDCLDARLRSQRIECSIAGFPGAIRHLGASDSSPYVIASGSRNVRGFTPRRFNIDHDDLVRPDPLVKLFDLRMRQCVATCPLPNFSPASSLDFTEKSITMTTVDGHLVEWDPSTFPEVSVVNTVDLRSPIECCATSSSDGSIACGTLEGQIQLFVSNDVDLPQPNFKRPLPEYPLPPRMMIHDNPIYPPFAKVSDIPPPLSSEVFPFTEGHCRHSDVVAYLLQVDHLMLRMPVQPPYTIHPDVLDRVTYPPPSETQVGTMTTSSSPLESGMPANSFLSRFHLHPSVSRQYIEVDPRKQQKSTKKKKKSLDQPTFCSLKHVETYPISRIIPSQITTTMMPRRYKRAQVHFTKRGLDGFNFCKYNPVAHRAIGLENHLPLSGLTNVVIQLLHGCCPELVQSRICRHWCEEPHCLTCELHFIFHRMNTLLVENQDHSGKPQTTALGTGNFLTVFRQLPQTLALGLLETPRGKPHLQLETCVRFILHHVTSDLPSSVAELFQVHLVVENECPKGHSSVQDTQNQVIPLLYNSRQGEQTTTTTPLLSFAQLVESSMVRNRVIDRAWCRNCQSYQRMTQRQSLSDDPALALPKILTFQCNIQSLDEASCWKQPHFVPSELVIGRRESLLFVQEGSKEEDSDNCTRYELVAVISSISSSSDGSSHFVLHMKQEQPGLSQDSDGWICYNDFRLTLTHVEDALALHPEWKQPCVLMYRQQSPIIRNLEELELPSQQGDILIPASVFSSPPLNVLTRGNKMIVPEPGEILALDTEMVTLEGEHTTVLTDGTQVVLTESRQAIARVSLVNAQEELVLDDYILPSEPIVDYLTRFSGIIPSDLDLHKSTRALHTLKNLGLKLHMLIHQHQCTFVGHGLAKDFRMLNVCVPKKQVVDTVELFHLAGRRKVALRFLMAYFFQQHIQTSEHDSIEDAKAALKLYDQYRVLQDVDHVLQDMYVAGEACRWKIADLVSFYQV